MMDLIGQTLGRYQIIEQIGQGGMATVFKAYQPGLNRYVAVKVLPPIHAKQPGFTERFQREAEAIANLNHPNILPVHDSGQEGQYSFIVMRYVEEARTLRELMVAMAPLSLAQIGDLIGQIAAALDYAHRQGVIHRDVKPGNVLMDGEWALLTDFGLAKMTEDSVQLTGTGVGLGTPAYMSPEQGQGQAVDHRTDIYALGTILFEMLTGKLPYSAETPVAVVFKRAHEPLPLPRSLNPDIPEAVEQVVLKALARSPDDRFSSAGEMVTALKVAVDEACGAAATVPLPTEEEQPTILSPEVVPSATPSPIESPTGKTLAEPFAGGAVPWKWLAGIGGAAVVAAGLFFTLSNGGEPAPTPAREPVVAALAATDTPTATSTQTPTEIPPTATPLPPTPTETPKPTPTDTSEPTPTNTSVPPMATPTRTPSPTVTHTPTHTPIPPTPTPSPTPGIGRIAFTSYQNYNWEIYVVNPDGSGLTNLTNNAVIDASPSWSPDGQRIAFSSYRDHQMSIYVMNTDGSGEIRLTTDPAYVDDSPVWSLDGQRFALTSKRGDNNLDIYVMNADGSGRNRLTNTPGVDSGPTWSPDGRRIAFFSRRDGNDEIYVMNADGSGQERLTNDPAFDTSPAWSPDGQRIAFSSNRDGNYEIYLMNPDGSGLTNLTNNSAGDFHPTWSPDSKRIAFVTMRDQPDSDCFDGRCGQEIYIMNADGSGVTRLTNNEPKDSSPSWGP